MSRFIRSRLVPDFSRQRGLVSEALTSRRKIVVEGCGTTGSWVAFSLAKMGFMNVTVTDIDRVEGVNLPAQMLFPRASASKPHSLRTMAYYAGCGGRIVPFFKYTADAQDIRFRRPPYKGRTIFSCVDTVEGRMEIAQAAKRLHAKELIDFRMGAEGGSAIFVGERALNWDAYIRTLATTSFEEVPSCGPRALLPNAMALVGLVLTRWLAVERGEAEPIQRFTLDSRNLMVLQEREEA